MDACPYKTPNIGVFIKAGLHLNCKLNTILYDDTCLRL